jgi:glycosyltransferase involved in cell wall biosynthesis
MAGMSFARSEIKDLVSVIIPTYRAERFIGNALASVAQQAYPHWEVIVVEDASCDGTQQIVEDFARRHGTHRVDFSRNERNSGPSQSRNVAFARADGEFIALLDADDRWLPEHLSNSVHALQTSKKDIVYSAVVMIEHKTELLLGIYGPEANDLADFPRGLLRRNFITPSATVLRRNVLADVGPWNTEFRYCEDLEFWLRSVEAGKQFHYIGGCHCLYAKNHPDAATQNQCAVHEALAEVVGRFIRLPNVSEEVCRRYAAKALRRAADFHLASDPLLDRSADPSRAAALLLKAWRLQPRKVNYLLRIAKIRAAGLIGRRPRHAAASLQPPPSKAAA